MIAHHCSRCAKYTSQKLRPINPKNTEPEPHRYEQPRPGVCAADTQHSKISKKEHIPRSDEHKR